MKQSEMVSLKIVPEMNFIGIKMLYNEILKKDNYWHFLYEGDHTLIRCQKKYFEQIKEWIVKHPSIRLELIEPWVEPWEFIRKYQKHFMILFHQFSIMSIKSNGSDSISFYTLERIAHLAHLQYQHQYKNMT